ncbi:MAG: AbgT family transporter [Phycisphaerales bacterium]|jgi:aminobenzoyl-glutamate transport protein|nr:AbgT family transporter [Phycisphaerales bacterium]
MAGHSPANGSSGSGPRGVLNMVERIGNRLPDPAILFMMGAALVMLCSAIAAWGGMSVQPKKLVVRTEAIVDAAGTPVIDPESGQPQVREVFDASGEPVLDLVANGDAITPRNLLSADGLYYAISSMVDNFVNFPPLGIVLVGVLGIGIAERTGFIGAALKAVMLVVPKRLLTPAMVFLGIMSSLGTDAGYVVLPPVAAALYKSVGRSPLAGIAAVFAGVAAGFNANLLITSLDPLLAGLTSQAGQTIDVNYRLEPTANWFFMIVSTVVISLTGWLVSDLFVEKRLRLRAPDDGGPSPVSSEELAAQRMDAVEQKGLVAGTITIVLATLVFVLFTLVPGGPFDDSLGKMGATPGLVRGADHFDRWIESIVPMLFILFILPGVVHGVIVGKLRSGKDLAALMVDTMAYMAPIIVLAFFAAQFIEYFKYSNLDKMLAHWGGQQLAASGLGAMPLMVAFILVTAVFNLFVGSMSAKYAMFAPIFVPMFMLVGISPALTQAAYRIGDSVSNVITPLNSYLIIILVVMQKYAPRAGMGTLIAMMMPYTIVFGIVWTLMLLIWMWTGTPLGPGGALEYVPPAH